MINSIDWCEPNNHIIPYISEFWNATSSFWLIFLGIYGATQHGVVYRYVSQKIYFLFFWLIIGGCFSILFHIYLSGWSDIPFSAILYGAISSIRSKKSLSIVSYSILNITFILTGIYWIFLASIVLNILEAIYLYKMLTNTILSRKLFITSIFLYIAAIVYYILDQTLCLEYGHLYLHTYWHILSGMAMYLYFLYIIEIFMVRICMIVPRCIKIFPFPYLCCEY